LLITGKNFRTDYIPALNENPIDLAGAGDSLLSISTLMLAQGSDAYQSGLMGSIAAAMQVSTLGNTPLSVSKLKQLISEIYP
jgi:bifunctional ADP-heptose synthase (sugar kinase/adenylyltransferase)